ncbi:hypothetical protein L249_4339 [Ophiocordyceps polyrhachis-furcata BCC 54312]|uniref:Apple domain-containing protein n=1 Tax=Ophiocordyceps polyrhachis-furcata BCC 54312 TaxID=1330021 RepID=A0A367L7W4_9HYPO|nr:hypothetical protein L249_4339 [Ophiocordyceps polyrhachis-furcata BCC 54312]
MKQTCPYLGLALFAVSLLATKVPFDDLLTIGQGYNTFLCEGRKHGAVIVEGLAKRGEAVPHEEPQPLFNFTPPSGDLTGVDVDDYFKPIDVSVIDQILVQERGRLERELFGSEEDGVLSRRRREAEESVEEWCNGRTTSYHNLISDYTEYQNFIDISASFIISYWGQKASVSGGYLDQAQACNRLDSPAAEAFSTQSMIYLAKIEFTKQQNVQQRFALNGTTYDTHKDHFVWAFGNKWVRSFEQGGKVIARVTVKAKESANRTEIKANMDAALGAWGARGEVSASAGRSMDDLSKQADIKFELFYEGVTGKRLKANTAAGRSSSPARDAILEAKSWAEEFLTNACHHDYKYRALLDKYDRLNEFPRSQQVREYDIAEPVSVEVLKALVKISEMAQNLRKNEQLTDEDKQEIRSAELDMIQAGKQWVKATAEDPTEVRQTSKHLLNSFNQGFLIKFKPKLPKSDVNRPSKAGVYTCVENRSNRTTWHCSNLETGLWHLNVEFSSRQYCQAACDEAADGINFNTESRDCAVNYLSVNLQLKQLDGGQDYDSFFVEATDASNRPTRWPLERISSLSDPSTAQIDGPVYFPPGESPQLSNLTLAIGGIKSDGRSEGRDSAEQAQIKFQPRSWSWELGAAQSRD